MVQGGYVQGVSTRSVHDLVQAMIWTARSRAM